MPVEFLSDEQARRYGRFNGDPSIAQLERFYLNDNDRALAHARHGDHNRLGFALQLCTVRFLGTFLPDPTNIPSVVVYRIAKQLGITDPACLNAYGQREQTFRSHTREIRDCLGYKDFHAPPERWRFIRWLFTRAWLSSERPTVLFDLATRRLIDRRILLPGVTTLVRLVASVRERATSRLWKALSRRVDDQQKVKLESLLQVGSEVRSSGLDRLRRAPTSVTAAALNTALNRIQEFRALELNGIDLTAFPIGRIRALARYAIAARAQTIERLVDDRRIATLLAFGKIHVAQDDAVEIFQQLITICLSRAERQEEQQRLRSLRDLDDAALRLAVAGEMRFTFCCREWICRTLFWRSPMRPDSPRNFLISARVTFASKTFVLAYVRFSWPRPVTSRWRPLHDQMSRLLRGTACPGSSRTTFAGKRSCELMRVLWNSNHGFHW